MLGRLALVLCVVAVASAEVTGEESVNAGEISLKKRGDLGFSSKRNEISLRSKRVVSQEDKEVILAAHNAYRKSEKAANIKKLEWSDSLEQTAQGWANQCKFSHGHPATPEPAFDSLGQNIFAKHPFETKINFTYIIQKWFEEKQFYEYESGLCSKVCGHYTQVVWHETTDIGCGYKQCATVEGLTWADALLVVCDYGPGGNWQGEKPYNKGPICSACPNKCEDGLCVE